MAADPMLPPGTEHPLARLRRLLLVGTPDQLQSYLARFHPSDLADLLEELPEAERREVLTALSPALAAEALSEMEWEERPGESLASLDPSRIAALIGQLSDDDAADIIGDLEPEDRDRVLAALPKLDARDIRDLLNYHEESAGGLMTTELVAVDERLSAAEAIDEVRRQGQQIDDFYTVFVINAERELIGTLPLHALVTAAPGRRIGDLIEPVLATVEPDTDQEEVGRILSRYNLVSVPVVDAERRLLGTVTFDDVIDVIEAETTEDILKFGGVSEEEEIRGDWADAIRSRLPWLCVNLVTAFGAASVVWFFEGTIDAIPVLAAWMPVIAGMGGNAGTQALAVTVRRLALSRESVSRRWQVVGKELLVGVGNGLAIGLAVAGVSVLLGQRPLLGLVVMSAMWLNLVVAGFAGAFVPIVLERAGVDPAVASSIFVTTFTDLIGFFLLLGLASALLL